MHCPRAAGGGNTCIVSEVIGCWQITAQYRRKRVLRVRSRPYKMVRVNVTCLLSFVMINRSVNKQLLDDCGLIEIFNGILRRLRIRLLS